MFGFEKKPENKEAKAQELKVVFDIELLDRAIRAAEQITAKSIFDNALWRGASVKESIDVLLDEITEAHVFALQIKKQLVSLSEKEEVI